VVRFLRLRAVGSGAGGTGAFVAQVAKRVLAVMLVPPVDLNAFGFGNGDVFRIGHLGFTLSISRTPEILRIAVTIRSSCFLSFTSMVMSMMAPAVLWTSSPRVSRLRMLVCSLNSAVVNWLSMPG